MQKIINLQLMDSIIALSVSILTTNITVPSAEFIRSNCQTDSLHVLDI